MFITFNIPIIALITLTILNFIIAFTVIFLERKNPSATLAWILVLFFLPFLGVVFYLIFSQNITRHKAFKMETPEYNILTAKIKEQSALMDKGLYPFNQKETASLRDMIKLHQGHSKAYYSQNNKMETFTDGEEKFNRLLKDIDEAKESINLMVFILKRDELGLEIIKRLTEKAKEGLDVRLLLDAMGSRKIDKHVLKDFIEAGGKHSFYFPSKLKYINLKLNYRNHRKIAVIDNKIGYTGGFNIGNEYLGLSKKKGYWRDTHIRIEGDSVIDLQNTFLLDWRFAAKENLPLSFNYNDHNIDGTTGIQIVSSGPSRKKGEIKHGYLKMIYSAEKSIYIQSPYFVPDESIQEALKTAALSGVDVRIMIPNKPDHIFVYWATYSYIGELLKRGARAYIYDNGFLHSKTICVDRKMASIGSANFDIRSFDLNFETNAFIYDIFEAEKQEDIFLEDIKNCHELTYTQYLRRSMYIKFKESISRLLSSIL